MDLSFLNEPFPEKVVIRRKESSEIIFTHNLPSSLPDIKCHTTRNFGQGIYTAAFVYANGSERGAYRDLVVKDDDRKCPFAGHCCSTE